MQRYDDLRDKLSRKNDRIGNKIDLKETWGFSASKGNYADMNKNLQKQISYTSKQQKELKNLQTTVEKGSEAWYEYKKRIDENIASMQDMKKEMAENAIAAAGLAQKKASGKADKLNAKNELYDAKIDNATTAKKQNRLIDKKISAIGSKQKAYDAAVKTDKENLKGAKKALNKFKSTKENKGILKDIKKCVKSGKRIKQKLLNKAYGLNDGGRLYKACVQYNAYLDARISDSEIAGLFKETAKQEKADLAMEKFENISTEYDNQISANEQKKTTLQNKISLAEEQGRKQTTAYYKGLVSAETAEQEKLKQKRASLIESLNNSVSDGSIKQGSEEWYAMQEAVNEVTNAIDESTLALAEYNNQIRQIRWDAFDSALETIKRINSETDFYLNMISNEEQVDDDGNFTEYGKASLSLHNASYENYLAQARKYAEEYQELLNSGDMSDENVIARLRELEDAQWDVREAAEGEKQAIIDLIR